MLICKLQSNIFIQLKTPLKELKQRSEEFFHYINNLMLKNK